LKEKVDAIIATCERWSSDSPIGEMADREAKVLVESIDNNQSEADKQEINRLVQYIHDSHRSVQISPSKAARLVGK
jgi:hypothetical protein